MPLPAAIPFLTGLGARAAIASTIPRIAGAANLGATALGLAQTFSDRSAQSSGWNETQNLIPERLRQSSTQYFEPTYKNNEVSLDFVPLSTGRQGIRKPNPLPKPGMWDRAKAWGGKAMGAANMLGNVAFGAAMLGQLPMMMGLGQSNSGVYDQTYMANPYQSSGLPMGWQ